MKNDDTPVTETVAGLPTAPLLVVIIVSAVKSEVGRIFRRINGL
jgi:hypothetical protein